MSSAQSHGIPEDPLLTIEITEPGIGLEGYVCIHAVGRVGAAGGIRCVRDVSKTEVQLLARAMTYKYAFFDVPRGGAKMGLRVGYEVSAEEKRNLIRAAARHLEPVLRRGSFWSPWGDMNFHNDELQVFFGAIGLEFTPDKTHNSSFRTAVSTFWSLQSVLKHRGLAPDMATVSIEGFGSVVSYLTPLLAGLGVKVVAVTNRIGGVLNRHGLDSARMVAMQEQYGDEWVEQGGDWERISHDDLFHVPADILMPSARVHSLNAERARTIPVRVLLPIANVPCSDEAVVILEERGIDVMPDYVVNGGGMMGHIRGADDAFGGVFMDMLGRMLRAARNTDRPVRMLADDVAHASFPRIADEAYVKDGRAMELLKSLSDRGLMPKSVVRRIQKSSAERIYERVRTLFNEP